MGNFGVRERSALVAVASCVGSSNGIMATAPVLIDLTMSSSESSDIESDAGSESDESVIVTEVIR